MKKKYICTGIHQTYQECRRDWTEGDDEGRKCFPNQHPQLLAQDFPNLWI